MAFGEYHDDWYVVFPDHPPEVSQSVLQWTLSRYEGIAIVIALQGRREGGREEGENYIFSHTNLSI